MKAVFSQKLKFCDIFFIFWHKMDKDLIFKSFLGAITVQGSFPRDASNILQKMNAKLQIFIFLPKRKICPVLVDFSNIFCCRH